MMKKLLKLNDTTWKKKVNEDVAETFDIEIGDIKQPDFKPQVKILRWDNECNFSIRRNEKRKGVVSEKDGVIKSTHPDLEDHFFEKPEGFEFETVLLTKPKSNVVEYSLETKGLKFHYQPELTQEEKDEGAERPENVVGSYAVYHESKAGDYSKMDGKNYRAGKAFHIYRPKIIDANGAEVWGKMNIDGGLLTITIPQSFLDNAMYPVVVDPTFGETGVGGTATNGVANYEQILIATSGSDAGSATIESITEYNASGGSGSDVKYILNNSSGNILTNGIAPSVNLPASASGSWRTSNYVSKPTIDASTIYWIGHLCDGGGGSGFKYYNDNTGSGTGRIDTTNNYTTPQDTNTTSDFYLKLSIYATYTAGGVTINPAVQSATFSIPTVTVSVSGAIINPAVQSATFSIPTVTVSVSGATVHPSVQTVTASVPAATVSTTIQEPAVQTVTFTVPTYSVILGITKSPSVQTVTASIPAHSVSLGAGQSPSAQAVTFSVPTYSVKLGLSVSASVQTATFSLPAETITTGLKVSPSVQVATFTVPAYIVLKGNLISAGVQVVTFTIPTYGVSMGTETLSTDLMLFTLSSGSINITPSVQVVTFTIPIYAVNTGQVLSPGVQTITASIPAYVVSLATVLSGGVQTATFTIPAYNAHAGITVPSVSVQTATFTIPASTITAILGVTAAVNVVVATFSLPTLAKVGEVWTKTARNVGSWGRTSRPTGSWTRSGRNSN